MCSYNVGAQELIGKVPRGEINNHLPLTKSHSDSSQTCPRQKFETELYLSFIIDRVSLHLLLFLRHGSNLGFQSVVPVANVLR